MKRLYRDTRHASGDRPAIKWDMLLERAMLSGPPDHVVEQIHELRNVCGIENAITFLEVGGVPYSDIMRSLELFGTKGMPAFQQGSIQGAPAGVHPIGTLSQLPKRKH